MDTTQCISNDIWERYAAGTLSGEAMHALLQHVAHCELCADIKEGIDALPQPEVLPQSIREINAEVDRRLQRPARKRLLVAWQYWSAAAVLVVALGIGWWYMDSPQKNIVQRESTPGIEHKAPTAPETPASEFAPGTPAPASKENTPVLHEKPKSDSKSLPPPTKGIQPVTENQAIQENDKFEQPTPTVAEQTDIVYADKEATEDFALKEKAPQVEKLGQFRATDAVVPAQPETIQAKEYKKKKREKEPSAFYNNNTDYNLYNNATGSGTDFTSAFAPSFDSAAYFTAENFYKQGLYDSSLVYLQSVDVAFISPYYEQGLLLLARVFIAQGKKPEATAILNRVIALNGPRREEAAGLLKTLE